MTERLQKIMARANVGSRRHNETLIRAGRVRLNGRVAKLGDRADLNVDVIEVDGRVLSLAEAQVQLTYIALNKPRGIISSLSDELDEGRRTVRDLIELPGHLYPVGRLDKQSEGLMLMTNDGQLAHRLTHPRYGHEKVYDVTVDGKLSALALTAWREGVMLDEKRTRPAKVLVMSEEQSTTRLQITMREGRKRQIRRVAAVLGYPVRRLIRRKIGPLHLGDLPSGRWRHLQPQEVAALQKSTQKGSRQRSGRRPTNSKRGRVKRK